MKTDLAIKLLTGKRLDKWKLFVYVWTYISYAKIHSWIWLCVHMFSHVETKQAMKRVWIFKERFKIWVLEMCNIHNAFLGICKTSLLGSKNVGIVAKGIYNIVLLEKEWVFRTILWKTKELWHDKKSLTYGRKPGLQQNLLQELSTY